MLAWRLYLLAKYKNVKSTIIALEIITYTQRNIKGQRLKRAVKYMQWRTEAVNSRSKRLNIVKR